MHDCCDMHLLLNTNDWCLIICIWLNDFGELIFSAETVSILFHVHIRKKNALNRSLISVDCLASDGENIMQKRKESTKDGTKGSHQKREMLLFLFGNSFGFEALDGHQCYRGNMMTWCLSVLPATFWTIATFGILQHLGIVLLSNSPLFGHFYVSACLGVTIDVLWPFGETCWSNSWWCLDEFRWPQRTQTIRSKILTSTYPC